MLRKNASVKGTSPGGTPTMPLVEPGDGSGGGDRLSRAAALECGVGADAAGHLADGMDGFLAARLDNVRGTELTGHLLALRVTAQGNDALRAEAPGGEHGGQADSAVPDHRYRVALLDPGNDGRVVPGRHHVGQCQQRLEYRIRVPRSGHRHEGAAGQRDAHRLALAAVDRPVAEAAAGHAGQG